MSLSGVWGETDGNPPPPGFGFVSPAPLTEVGGSSQLQFMRSPKAPNVGMQKLVIDRNSSHSSLVRSSSDSFGSSRSRGSSNSFGSSIPSNTSSTKDASSSVSGSYQSAGHGTHSHMESREVASSSGYSQSHRAIACWNALRDSKSSGSGGSSSDTSNTSRLSCPSASAL